MNRYNLASYAEIPRFASLELKYKGKSYYVIPECIQPYSSLNLFENQSIIIPAIDGPIDDFISNIYTGCFQINKNNAPFYYSLGLVLGITDLEKAAQKFVMELDTNYEVLVDIANNLALSEKFPTVLISQLAENFSQVLNTSAVQKSPASLIREVKSSQHFNLINPGAFGRYVLSRIPNDKSFEQILVEHTEINIKDPSMLNEILKHPNVDISQFGPYLQNILMSYIGSEESFLYNPENPQTGFIHSLIKSNNQSPIESGSIEVMADTIFNQQFTPDKIFMYDQPDLYYCSSEASQPVVSLTISIKQGTFRLSGYTLEGRWGEKGCVGPISWKVEGSTDNEEWTLLDERNDDRSIVSKPGPAYFEVKGQQHFRQLRFTQLNSSGRNNKRFILASLELYGAYIKE